MSIQRIVTIGPGKSGFLPIIRSARRLLVTFSLIRYLVGLAGVLSELKDPLGKFL